MYLSLIVKFLGDKVTLWICTIDLLIYLVTMSFFIIPLMIEKKMSQEN